MTVRVVALTLVALALSASTAAAQGNPPVEALLPADGAALPVSPGGIELRYSCPLYIVSGEPPFAVYGGRRDYGTVVATRPDVGNDGRLLQSNWIDLPPSDDLQDNDLPEDQCRTFFAEDNWHLTPGTYYWQAYRICLACPGDYEATPVRSFRLTAIGSGTSLAVKLPRRAYGGIPFHTEVGGRALPSGGTVRLQARRGSSGAWKTVRGVTVLTDRDTQESTGVGPAQLAAGRYSVRAVMTLGDEEITSPAKRLTVAKAARWPRGAAGRWREPSGLDVEFAVSADGRTLRGGSFGVSTLCPQAPLPDGSPQFTTMLLQAPVPRARMAPDGSFAWAGKVGRHNVYAYGRISGKSAQGRVQLGLGACTGGSSWKAVKR